MSAILWMPRMRNNARGIQMSQKGVIYILTNLSQEILEEVRDGKRGKDEKSSRKT